MVKSLFDCCLECVASNIQHICWLHIPEIIAEQIVEKAVKLEKFQRDDEAGLVLRRLVEIYPTKVLRSVKIECLVFLNNVEHRFTAVLPGLVRIDLSFTLLGKHDVLSDIPRYALNCKQLILHHADLDMGAVRCLTSPIFLAIHQNKPYSPIEILDLSNNPKVLPLEHFPRVLKIPSLQLLIFEPTFNFTEIKRTFAPDWDLREVSSETKQSLKTKNTGWLEKVFAVGSPVMRVFGRHFPVPTLTLPEQPLRYASYGLYRRSCQRENNMDKSLVLSFH